VTGGDAEELFLFPEAPGRYLLCVEWKTQDGESGWVETSFTVGAGEQVEQVGPEKLELDDDTEMWVFNAWEGTRFSSHESKILPLLQEIIKPGDVIYDVGANLGFYTIRFGRLTGPTGRVYAVEANPLCAYFLRANLGLNNVRNAEILPVALLDSARSCAFTVNYHHSGIGLTSAAPTYSLKAGHEITVHTTSLDDLLEAHGLLKPNVVKVDIEGAEAWALRGMRRTLSESKPRMLLEFHGKVAATQALDVLKEYPYRFKETGSLKEFENAETLSEWFPDAVLQVLAYPR